MQRSIAALMMILIRSSCLAHETTVEGIVNLRVEKLSEGVYLATSEQVPGLIAQGRTVTETLEIARDVAKKLLEARAQRQESTLLSPVADTFDYPLVVHG